MSAKGLLFEKVLRGVQWSSFVPNTVALGSTSITKMIQACHPYVFLGLGVSEGGVFGYSGALLILRLPAGRSAGAADLGEVTCSVVEFEVLFAQFRIHYLYLDTPV